MPVGGERAVSKPGKISVCQSSRSKEKVPDMGTKKTKPNQDKTKKKQKKIPNKQKNPTTLSSSCFKVLEKLM